MASLVDDWSSLEGDLLGPLRWQRHPLTLARFGIRALRTARGLAESLFRGSRARALFVGLSAHSMLPLDKLASAAFGHVLGITGHAVGWPIPRGGAQKISDALVSYLRSLGGEVLTDARACLLRFLDVLPCGLSLSCGSHLEPPFAMFKNILKNERIDIKRKRSARNPLSLLSAPSPLVVAYFPRTHQ
jgi:hypothetical protein